jgi:shikimate kinase
MKLILMGLRGSGKSTIGRRLAERHGLAFIDLDDQTPGVLGAASVAEAWSRHGEAAFRVAEVAALRAAIEEDPAILALGGGTPTAPGAAEILAGLRTPQGDRPRLVYLRAPAAVLAGRLAAGGVAGRPSLTGADPIGEIGAVLAARDPLYRRIADEVLDVSDLDTEAICAALERLLAAG